MRPAIVSGIVTGDAPISYWPFFSLSQKSLRTLARPSSSLISKVVNDKNIVTNSIDFSL